MEGGLPPRTNGDSPCFPCFALKGERARVSPHEQLRMVGIETLRSGTREEFVCEACGQRMIRFLATQIDPPPSDRWRFESAAQPARTESIPPVADTAVQSIDELAADPVTEVDLAPAESGDVGLEEPSALRDFIDAVE